MQQPSKQQPLGNVSLSSQRPTAKGLDSLRVQLASIQDSSNKQSSGLEFSEFQDQTDVVGNQIPDHPPTMESLSCVPDRRLLISA